MLRTRWLYLICGALILLLYGQLWLGHRTHMPSVSQAIEQHLPQAQASKESLSVDVTMAQLVDAARRRPHLALVGAALVAVAIALFVVGLLLNVQWALAKRRRASRSNAVSRLAYRWPMGDLARLLVLLGMLLLFLPFIHIGLMAWDFATFENPRFWSVCGMFMLDALLLLFVWGLASTRTVRFTTALGLSGRKPADDVRRGLAAYATTFPWMIGVFFLVLQLCQRFGFSPPAEPIQQFLMTEQRDWLFGLTLLLACVVGPITEEIFFRGVLFTALRTRCKPHWAILLSGAIFAAAHANIVGFLPICLLGCMLAAVYERTGSLLSPIAVHVVHNFLLVGSALTAKALFGGIVP